jgi:hypothetical protein
MAATPVFSLSAPCKRRETTIDWGSKPGKCDRRESSKGVFAIKKFHRTALREAGGGIPGETLAPSGGEP